MSLETPDRIRASGVLLFQNWEDPDPENITVQLRGSVGFQQPQMLIDEDLDEDGTMIMQLDNAVSNDEAAVFVSGDSHVTFDQGGGYITPMATWDDIPVLDELPDNTLVIQEIDGNRDAFRLYVVVFRMQFEGEAITQLQPTG